MREIRDIIVFINRMDKHLERIHVELQDVIRRLEELAYRISEEFRNDALRAMDEVSKEMRKRIEEEMKNLKDQILKEEEEKLNELIERAQKNMNKAVDYVVTRLTQTSAG